MTADEDRVRALHQRVLDGWNQGSGATFGAPFTDDALFIGFDGTVFHGRREIADGHQELFDRWLKGSRLISERTTVRMLTRDVAIVHAIGGTIMPGKSRPAPERDSIQTLIAVRDQEAWSFVSFQNTRLRRIGANTASALLWLVPDKLWGLLFWATGATPRTTTTL